MNHKHLFAALACTLVLAAGPALAHDGEDHSEKPVAPAATGGAPRIEAHSELFELVGRVEHGVMTIHLDRYADNTPVTNARIEIESGKTSGVAVPNKDGTYSFKSPLFDKPAPLSLTFTVSAGGDDDLLAGDLVPAAGEEHDHPQAAATWAGFTPLRIAGALALALLAALGAGLALRARRRNTVKEYK
ncbi:hypothetical protein [Massilia glaciei]|uniref:Carboxypeptidase regulatory-like domain-containing protein n=1 Tax=Massilia glaciei TaxID=1524097 RepID=A0A2U2HN08_9BURK|nr:hypothetical protein [Massilia glaciei]PWF48883.1 hypothetical protein C7C56_009525 [Massilia glaciei]